MSDLVERLRDLAPQCETSEQALFFHQAADHIEALEAALPTREAIARVIFPNAFLDEHEKSPPIRIWTQAMQDAAFETADAVLALFPTLAPEQDK